MTQGTAKGLAVALALVAVSAIAGCGGATGDEVDYDGRYVGSWTLKTASAMEMERWELYADGTAALTASNLAAPLEIAAKGAVSCSFGDRWSSDGPAALEVVLRCTDGVDRLATIAFPEAVAPRLTPSAIDVVSVDGEQDWAPRAGALTLSMSR